MNEGKKIDRQSNVEIRNRAKFPGVVGMVRLEDRKTKNNYRG